ncbi:MAG: 4-(cytidine 5'-diphospho)-2-C-methyl-D-erythritol kinase [Candidatus Bipolaricaulota bacterium]
MRVEALAFAKLNLALRVRGRRSDGFHELESIVQTIDVADRITLTLGPGHQLAVQNSAGPFTEPDLAERAAISVLAAKGAKRGIGIRIAKTIPPGTGLGGGSSNAAIVLRVLDAGIPPSLGPRRLAAIAEQLGSDVPLFLSGGRLRVRGRGERLDRIASGCETFVVVVPYERCETAAVYAAYDRIQTGVEERELALGENDLLAAALHVAPGLRRVAAAVQEAGELYAGMSGSGSAFYAACSSRAGAEKAAERLRRAPFAAVWIAESTPEGGRWERGDGG